MNGLYITSETKFVISELLNANEKLLCCKKCKNCKIFDAVNDEMKIKISIVIFYKNNAFHALKIYRKGACAKNKSPPL